MKIALAQLDFQVGNFTSNSQKIINAIQKAKKNNSQLIIFPELAVTGCPSQDFLTYQSFIAKCYLALDEIKLHCNNITAIIGSPEINKDNCGNPLYNAAFIISDGEIISTVRKTVLANYDVFDEYRYFELGKNFDVININGYKIAITIGEDLSNIQDHSLCIKHPMEELIKQNPDFIINIDASPFNYNRVETRYDILSAYAKKYGIPVIYVNQIGAQNELIFDGGSSVINSSGNIVHQLPFFKESVEYIDFKNIDSVTSLCEQDINKISLVYDALITGIRDYFFKTGFKKAILGLSGGLDSAVCLVLASQALGKENVWSVLMPSLFSSEHSVSDARILAENIGCKWDLININKIYDSIISSLNPLFANLPFNTTEENIQARIRAIILMALSNKFGYILINTSNKSEIATGYGTLYGDMCGGISVLGDLYKTKVYELANYINSEREIIPYNIITKLPSAELKPDQRDTDTLPEYPLLDNILYQYIEEGKTALQIINSGFDAAIVNRVIHFVNTSEYKRFQAPPVLRITSKAFGIGRRMPLEGKYDF